VIVDIKNASWRYLRSIILARNLGEDVKVIDTVKTDVVVNSSLERTRRLLKSRAKMEMRDPAALLRSRIQEISSSQKEAEKMEENDFKTDLILNDVDEFCRYVIITYYKWKLPNLSEFWLWFKYSKKFLKSGRPGQCGENTRAGKDDPERARDRG